MKKYNIDKDSSEYKKRETVVNSMGLANSAIRDIIHDMTNLNRNQQKKTRQSAKGLKILTPQQMLSRLPISFAQLQAGNNSQKLQNEIRKLLYSLYRSKNLSKTIYENLINTI